MFPELGQIDPQAPRDERLKQLAALLTDPQNGRFTRTIVNRLWHRLMGRGIVHPVDAMQTEPWSADLLDYLAVDLADNGYDLKQHAAADRHFAGLPVAGGRARRAARRVRIRLHRPDRQADDGRTVRRRRLANHRHGADRAAQKRDRVL